ncbi:Hypothetical predicted protein [Pelobates cultripes]|uniref:Uncharacterized protein n=1 Tax=Pelobates cultripes TaxID=61616 RepID=A0AAD1VLE1_PELCU|nr:Hypothetical predicted protein [Pelobates cultripes]
MYDYDPVRFGLSPREREGIIELLGLMDPIELNKLARTISGSKRVRRGTGKAPSALTGLDTAIDLILKRTRNAEQLLKRKKVSHEVIFQYLRGKNVRVPDTYKKPDLINNVLKLWGIQIEQ